MAISEPEDVLGIEGLEEPEVIGVGGFATVYKAFQPAFRRTVAVKVLAMTSLDDRSRERFERECQAMGSISEHPSIVTVHDAGFTATGRPYLVMAHLSGGSLQDRLDQAGTMTWQEATLAGVLLAGALETSHRADIIHRDIKPANVLISQYGEPQLTDFGIARISGGHETRSGVITASMSHAPPEILDGLRPTVGADVYSLASTIFELMYGKPPFSSDTDESMVPMLRRILTEDPPDLRPTGVPDAVCTVLERAMAKKPEDRYESAEEFGRALQECRSQEHLEPGRMVVAAVPGEVRALAGANAQATAEIPSVDLAKGSAAPPFAPTPMGAPPVPGVPPPGGGVPTPAGVAPKRSRGLLVGVGVFVLVAVAAVVALVALGGGDETADGPETTTTLPTEFTPAIERRFVAACRERVGDTVDNFRDARDLCECTFERIRDEIAIADFLAAEADPEGEAAEPVRKQITELTGECISDLGLEGIQTADGS